MTREFWIYKCPLLSPQVWTKNPNNPLAIHVREVMPGDMFKAPLHIHDECQEKLDRIALALARLDEIIKVVKNCEEDIDKDWLLEVLTAPIFNTEVTGRVETNE